MWIFVYCVQFCIYRCLGSLIVLFCSISVVKCKLGCMELKSVRMDCVLVCVESKMRRMSSTYWK